MAKQKIKKYMFAVGESCKNSCDCNCTLHDDLIIYEEVKSYTPPLHKDCDYYLIPEDSLIFGLIQLRKAWLNLLKAFGEVFGIEWLVRKLDTWLRKINQQ